MAKVEVDYREFFGEFHHSLHSGGALIVSRDARGKPNPMTIGWGSLGTIWGLPICTVLVRPSRYTYSCLEASGDFTLNIPYAKHAQDVMLCGTRSGRDLDKMAAAAFSALPSETIESPGVAECGLVLECAIVQKHDLDPDALAPNIVASAYPRGDFHRVYYGQIYRAVADADFRERFWG
jgi:flavin reductase (DIM6/NTAB) family NADH-FMN oxidoreductase RutF